MMSAWFECRIQIQQNRSEERSINGSSVAAVARLLYYFLFRYTIYLLIDIFSACACNMFGSIRDDCEQTTGRCVCKSHVTGQKCNICSNGKELGLHGCTGNVRFISTASFHQQVDNIFREALTDNESNYLRRLCERLYPTGCAAFSSSPRFSASNRDWSQVRLGIDYSTKSSLESTLNSDVDFCELVSAIYSIATILENIRDIIEFFRCCDKMTVNLFWFLLL